MMKSIEFCSYCNQDTVHLVYVSERHNKRFRNHKCKICKKNSYTEVLD